MADALKDVAGSDYSIIDFALIGLSKKITEKALIGVVGNSNITSGVLKGIGGVGLSVAADSQSGLFKKGGNIIAAGLIIDGVEDIWTQALPMITGQNVAAQTNTQSGIVYM